MVIHLLSFLSNIIINEAEGKREIMHTKKKRVKKVEKKLAVFLATHVWRIHQRISSRGLFG